MTLKPNGENAVWAVDGGNKMNLFYIKHQFVCPKLIRLFIKYTSFYVLIIPQ